ncbi:MAG: hypothetical protein ACN4F8_16955 [Hydrogenophaga sp.]
MLEMTACQVTGWQPRSPHLNVCRGFSRDVDGAVVRVAAKNKGTAGTAVEWMISRIFTWLGANATAPARSPACRFT